MPLSLTVRAKDLRRLVSLLGEERPSVEDELIPASFLVDLAAIIGCDDVTFALVDAYRDSSINQTYLPSGPLLEETAEEEEHWGRLFWSAYWGPGGCSYVEDTGDRTSVLRSSDDGSLRERNKWPMSQFTRHYGIKHEAMLSLPQLRGAERRLMFFRFDGPDFTERDLLLLALLRPHLDKIHRECDRRRRRPQLTARQWEILELVAAGSSNCDLAKQLVLSEATVRKHLENAFERLDVNSRTAAVAKVTPFLQNA